MKTIDLNLANFSFAQKLKLFETLWDEIAKEEGNYSSPEWHEPILKDRQSSYETGKDSPSDWNEARKRIKKNLSCE